MTQTKTQRKRYESATWLASMDWGPTTKAAGSYRKQVIMQAKAADRRVEKRKQSSKALNITS